MRMPLLVELSTFLGAAVLFWTALCLVRPGRRLVGIVAGCAGLIAGAAAALVYTLDGLARGLDVDRIPHEPAAQWFVAAFGWGGLLAALLSARVPAIRERLSDSRMKRS